MTDQRLKAILKVLLYMTPANVQTRLAKLREAEREALRDWLGEIAKEARERIDNGERRAHGAAPVVPARDHESGAAESKHG